MMLLCIVVREENTMSTTIKERSKRRKKAMEQQLALISEKSPDAFEWLEAKCSAHIDEKIKPEQMTTAKKRLQWELKMIQEHRLAVIFLHLHQYMEMAGITAEEVLHRGFLPCSVVAYLLGLTSLNPITYGLPTELFYGKYKNDSFVYELPSLEFAVSHKTRERSFDILKRLPGVGDAVELGWEHQLWIAFLPQENAPEIGPVFHKDNGSTCAVFYQEAKEKCWYWGISADQHLEHLSLLYQRTGVRPENIDPGDQGVLDYLRNGTVSPREVLCPADLRLETLGLGILTPKFEELVSLLNPASFNDFVKITGLLYCSGAWTEKIQSMVKTGELTIKNIFATREDIKEYLVGKGIPSEKGICPQGSHSVFRSLPPGTRGPGGKFHPRNLCKGTRDPSGRSCFSPPE